MEELSDKIWGGVLSGGMFMKVAVLARTEKDVAYIKYLLSQGQEIAFCDDPLQADAVIVDTELLTPAEKEVLKALADYGSIGRSSSENLQSESDSQEAPLLCQEETESENEHPSHRFCPPLQAHPLTVVQPFDALD